MSRDNLQPDAAVLAVADDLLDRLGGNAATRFSLLGEAHFKVIDDDAIDLARALGAVMPPEPGEPEPQYMRVAFDVDAALPAPGAYIVLTDDQGHADVCCTLVVAGHGMEDLALPGGPMLPGHALLATWRVQDLIGDAHEND